MGWQPGWSKGKTPGGHSWMRLWYHNTLVLGSVLLILSDLLQDCASFHSGARQLFPLLSHFYTIYFSFCKFCSIKMLKRKGKSRRLKYFKYWTERQYIYYMSEEGFLCFRKGLRWRMGRDLVWDTFIRALITSLKLLMLSWFNNFPEALSPYYHLEHQTRRMNLGCRETNIRL